MKKISKSNSKPVPVKVVSGTLEEPKKPITRTVTPAKLVKDQQERPITIYGQLVIDPKSKATHFEHQHYDEKKGRSVVEKVTVKIEKK